MARTDWTGDVALAAFDDGFEEGTATVAPDTAAMDRIAAALKGWDADAGDWGDIVVDIIGIVRGTNRAVEDHPREEGISSA